jgi:glutamate/tyrosine decarboxylase-like PLP-dependent enzyme
MVNATVGTTVSGAIDPVEQIGLICKKYKVWLHVDAALGGALWMSDKLRDKIGNC